MIDVRGQNSVMIIVAGEDTVEVPVKDMVALFHSILGSVDFIKLPC